MQLSALELSLLLNGQLEGNPEVRVSRLAKIEEALPGDVSFIANPKYERFVKTTGASVLIVNRDFEAELSQNIVLIRVEDAYASFTRLLELHSRLNRPKGIEQPCFIHSEAQIGEDVYVGAFAYIGKNAVIGHQSLIYPQTYIGDNVQIGANTLICAGVKIYEGCQIGNRCIIHSGAVIGSDGFGFAPQPDGSYKKIPQTGIVIVEDAVEIGANTCIDRATMGATVIRNGVKLDNLIQIAHNVEIDEHTVIAAQAGISGSTKVGRFCMIGGQAGLVGHLTVANRTKINAQSGVTKSVEKEGQFLSGSPAFEFRNQMRAYSIFKQLPELESRFKALENRVNSAG
ncbi:MAG: UDP-3-O-(3-hydroxymyristoyl)glucosamine N-acyltransferase [Sphingobacteriales bacterium]|nr:MAG: UDP-3-O-(3-hydroxymyristoyl)glucosamine N-acyltransferase [Sphingobacteriales bacterium]